MDDWIDYYNSTHTIYASKRHRDLHFQIVARDIIGYISSPDAVVLDYACGEALSAAKVAEACGQLILAEPAPGVRGRLIARFAPNTRIRVRSLDDVRKMAGEVGRSRGDEFGRPVHDLGRARFRARGDQAAPETRRPAGFGRYLAPRGRHGQRRARAVALRRSPRLPQGRPDRADLDRAVGLPAIALPRRAAALRRGRDDRASSRPPDLPPRAPIRISGTIRGG